MQVSSGPRPLSFVAVLAAVTLLGTTGDAAAETVRVFAVGYKQRLADAVSYAAYRNKMLALVDAGHPQRSTLVQAGVDDVATHLSPADPDAPSLALVNFPEDAGLIAGLIGSRGATARSQSTSTAAIVALLDAYAPLIAHYTGVFGVGHPIGDLFVAATDTFYRSFYETFRDMAVSRGVYVTASADIAPARRLEAADDPALVALLRDPDEPGRSYAYQAVSPEIRNVVFIFAPDGEILVPQPDGSTLRSPSETGGVILPSISKAYLVPLELALLGVVVTPLRDMDVVDTPVGRIGVVISKDAWMPDVNDRLAVKNAQLLLQSEAFDQWGFQTAEWAPDVFKEGGFGHVQRHPAFLVNVAPSLTGNLFEITFDGQTTILGKRTKTPPGPLATSNAWVGQNADTGFLALGPWVMDDPGIATPALSLADRRAALVAAGTALLPSSGIACASDLAVGACRNGYREAIVWTDIELPGGAVVTVPPDTAPRQPTAFGTNRRLNPPDGAVPSRQSYPRIDAVRRKVAVVWQDGRHGLPSIYMAQSRDGGDTFDPAVKVSDNAPGAVAELVPEVAIAHGTVLVVWQEFVSGSDDDRGRIRLARFATNGGKRGGDVRVDDGGDAAGTWRPAIAAAGRRVYVTWVDERDTSSAGIPFEHIYLARSTNGGETFEPARRIDAGEPVALAASLDNKWAPAIAAHRRTVTLAWVDFRDYNWDVFGATSIDRGLTFGPNVRIDDFDAIERLNESPAIAIVPATGRVVAAWTDLRAREPDTNVFFATSGDEGTSFSPNARLDDAAEGFDPDRDTPSNQWAPRLSAGRSDVCAAWQDDRAGNNDVFFAASRDGGLGFGPDERVDDSGDGPSDQYHPDVALVRRRGVTVCHVVWEDTRDGDADVYLATRTLP
jgi:hypothetical protein